jgi:hypothetical protein
MCDTRINLELAVSSKAALIFRNSRWNMMTNQITNINGRKQWDSVHKCPKCGHVLSLSEIDLMTAASGMVDCPKCSWSGPVEIQIVERKKPTE